jgi:hypothetical protein
LSGFTQGEKERKFFFGLNIGTKIANKNYASRYGGWYQNELPNTLLNNPTHYQNVRYILNDIDFTLPFDYFSQNMRYSPGLLTGLLFGYSLSPNLQASVEANFNKLKVRDVFSIEVFDPSNQTSQEQYELGEIYAEESRFNGKFNFDYISDGERAKYIIGLSGLFGAWRIDQHIASFRGYQMNLFSVHNPTNNINNVVSGLGWGAGINLGIEYRFKPSIVAQIMYQPNHAQYDFDFTPARTLLIQHDLVVRILWK